MATVSEAFRQYLSAKTPGQHERAKAGRYRDRIGDVLAEKLQLIEFFDSGSFTNGTGISYRSDVDYVARLAYDTKPSTSTTALNRVRDAP
jgi:hypothetical protein